MSDPFDNALATLVSPRPDDPLHYLERLRTTRLTHFRHTVFVNFDELGRVHPDSFPGRMPQSWTREQVSQLVERLDSEVPSAAVRALIITRRSLTSSTIQLPSIAPSRGPEEAPLSTVGREAAFLLESYRVGTFPPLASSLELRYSTDELREWWEAGGEPFDAAQRLAWYLRQTGGASQYVEAGDDWPLYLLDALEALAKDENDPPKVGLAIRDVSSRLSRRHVEALLARVDVETPCAAVNPQMHVASLRELGESSRQVVTDDLELVRHSTIGREARLLIEGYRRGMYPPMPSWSPHLPDAEQLREWWQAEQQQSDPDQPVP